MFNPTPFNMKFDPATAIQQLKQFGEFGGVNPSITDSATFTFLGARTMVETFEGSTEGCYLYSRHWNPMNKYLSDALAAMEGTEAAWVTASGMAAITCTILQICNSGDHIVTSATTYGGTFAFLKNYLPKFNIEVTFVNINNLEEVKAAIKPNTKLIYSETISNPLLRVADLEAVSAIAKAHNLKFVVDNTFAPMMISPVNHGVDVVIHSLTKFINGKNDCVAGVICSTNEFINSLINVNNGTAMLLGPVLDPLRSANILKNIHTLHIRMKQHSYNAMYLAQKLNEYKQLNVNYPGLPDHPEHELIQKMFRPEFGFGGLLTIDAGSNQKAASLMELMQSRDVGYLAVSLGYFKTLMSNSGSSTSSEVPEDTQKKIGLTPGLIRFSIGLDNDIENTFQIMKQCMVELEII